MATVYTALDHNGYSICTILADNPQSARAEIKRQLDRHGRRGYLADWQKAGEPVKNKETGEKV